MKFHIHGKQLDLGETLQTHAESRLTEMITKYSARPVEAVVTMSRDRHEFLCDATVHLSTGLRCQAKAHSSDVYECFENMLVRMETQLRRYKRRLKNHHANRSSPIKSSDASTYVLSSTLGDDSSDEPETLQPIIIAEVPTAVSSFSVGEAVMQMELSNANLLVFRNDAHGGVNVVYRRDDGNIGWIDPHSAE